MRIRDFRTRKGSEEGFTLVELLIVTLIIPIIVGALAAGLLAVFTLQSSAASRLTDTGESQTVGAFFQPDVQGAAEITTYAGTSPSCETAGQTQILGLEWGLINGYNNYQTVVSYVEVANGSTNNTVNLVRNYCTYGEVSGTYTQLSLASHVLSYNLPATQTLPVITCPASVTSTQCNVASTGFMTTANVTNVQFNLSDTNGKDTFPYTLVAAPAASATAASTGSPVTGTTSTSCGFATSGSGYYASTMCFVDFSSLTGPTLQAATAAGSCLEMSASLPGNYVLYFCINISGSAIKVSQFPTWTEYSGSTIINGAFLGNDINGVPFYTNVPGDPALYQNAAGTTTITITKIAVLSPQGVPASGWEATSADAESTDANESIVWSSDKALTIIPDDEAVDVANDPVGNACATDIVAGAVASTGLVQLSPTSIECYGTFNGYDTASIKNGAAMVEAVTPTTMTMTMVGTGLEAVSFGLLVP